MKKVWIGTLVGMILVAAAIIYYWKLAPKPPQVLDGLASVSPTPTPEELLQWKDQAGFSFTYPKSLKSDIHEEDQENYAHIELTHPEHPGTIIIWAKDTTMADAAAWIKNDKTLAVGTTFDTTFADMDAQKVLITAPKKKVITAVVDDAIVFFVEGEFEDSDYWIQTYDTIISTFAFTTDASTTAQADVVDEEEILE